MPYNTTNVVSIKKIHYNFFFKYIKNKNVFAAHLIEENDISWICKSRPAIILRRFVKRHGKDKDKYLLIPFTSKDTIKAWINGMELFRIEFNHPIFNGRPSYLMIEAMTLVNEKDIDGIYNFGSPDEFKSLKMTTALQRWVNREIKKKLNALFDADF